MSFPHRTLLSLPPSSFHSGFLLHDPPVALPHDLPVFLLLHGRVSLPLPYPVPGLAGRPDASQPLPDHGGVLLRWERWGRNQIDRLERAREQVKEEMMSYRKKTNGSLICHKPTLNTLRAEGHTERGREDEEERFTPAFCTSHHSLFLSSHLPAS